ncbi:MAG TPA: hypothetical protein PLY80_08615 [Pseudomonadota bacterium]|nr:hypothetical protein [Pseudomonadota bacterium]HNF96048.1 hypothetical protein [Pseudomonadota bacterium]
MPQLSHGESAEAEVPPSPASLAGLRSLPGAGLSGVLTTCAAALRPIGSGSSSWAMGIDADAAVAATAATPPPGP